MLHEKLEVKIHQKESSPQMGIKLTTTRSRVWHAHHWAIRAGLTFSDKRRKFILSWRNTANWLSMWLFSKGSYMASGQGGLLIEWLIVWCFMPFSTSFQAASAPIQDLPEFFLPILCTPFFPSHWLLSHCRRNGMGWERNESCCYEYHQLLERILTEPELKPVTP